MDRIIEIKVNGSHLTKDNRIAGVQHEGNAKTLRIEFDEGWDGYAKKVTFWDATGENPVERTLTADLLEDITKSIRIYLCKIPPEPMAEAGEFTFVIDGYTDGVRQRSISDTMVVKPAPFIEHADEPTDPTPSQAEQLQVQIETFLGTVQEAVLARDEAVDASEAAQKSAKNAAASETAAKTAQTSAAKSASDAASDAGIAASSASTATQAASTATTKAGEAAASEKVAADAKTSAETAATGAAASAAAAAKSQEQANRAATLAQSYTINPPKIGENGNWWLWNGTQYVDSNVNSGGGAAVQSDWDESDPVATSYVRHRTHWKDYTQKAETLLAETNVKFTNELSSVGGVGTGNLTAGLICKVKWNGTVYTCTAFASGGSVLLGNAALNSIGDDTGEPFLLEAFAATTSYLTKSTATAETVTISIETEEIATWHPLDRRFIPELDYAKEAPTKVSELDNDAGFITDSAVPKRTSQLTNDSGFVTASAVPTKTSQLTNDAGFLTKTTMSVPTKTSQLTNDSGYITAGAVPKKVSQLTNDAGYITKEEIPAVSFYDLEDNPFEEATLPEEEEILPTVHYTLTDGAAYPDEVFDIVEGDTYIVSWNGVTYECVAEINSIGNYTLNQTGVFTIIKYPDSDLVDVYADDGSASVTLSIRHRMVGGTGYLVDARHVVLTSSNGTRFLLSVTNEGKLTVAEVTG